LIKSQDHIPDGTARVPIWTFYSFETLVIYRGISMQRQPGGKLARPALPTEAVIVPRQNIKIKTNLNNEI
jgi:hypothetical protein